MSAKLQPVFLPTPCPSCHAQSGLLKGPPNASWLELRCASCQKFIKPVKNQDRIEPPSKEKPRAIPLRNACRCGHSQGVAHKRGPHWVVRCADCDAYSHNASEAEIFKSRSISAPKSKPKVIQVKPGPSAPTLASVSELRPIREKEELRKEVQSGLRRLAVKQTVADLANHLTRPFQPEDPGSKPTADSALGEETKAWIRGSLEFLEKEKLLQEWDRTRVRMFLTCLQTADALNRSDWAYANQLLLDYQRHLTRPPGL